MTAPTPRPLWQWVLASGTAGLLLALLPALFGLSYFGLDLTRVDLPFQCELRGHLQHLEGLQLSRAIGNGEPLFANPHAQALYPLRWLQVVLPQYAGLQLGVALHLALRVSGSFVAAVTADAARGPINFEYQIPNLRLALSLGLAGLAAAAALLLGMRHRSKRA